MTLLSLLNKRMLLKFIHQTLENIFQLRTALLFLTKRLAKIGWMIPNLAILLEDDEKDGVFGESYNEMIIAALGGIDRVYVTSSNIRY